MGVMSYKQTRSPGVPSGFFKDVKGIRQKPVGRKIVTPMRQVQAGPRLPSHYYSPLPAFQPAHVSPSMRAHYIKPLPAVHLSPMVSLPAGGGHALCMSKPWLCEAQERGLSSPAGHICFSSPWLCAGLPHPTPPTPPTLLPPDHFLCESQPQLCAGFPHPTPPQALPVSHPMCFLYPFLC